MKVDIRTFPEHPPDAPIDKSAVLIVDFEGRLVAGTGEVVLRDTMNALVAEDWKMILLNLSEITRIDSAGIGELMASIKLATRFGCEVRLVNVKGQVLDILRLSQLLPLLKVHESEHEAIDAFHVQAN
ncbi:MAG: STAS domain-containing protein [Holophagales bacterium]|nr:STAS domain-containing protein [Holophagales bacterium]